jgi:hypothetical protein
MLGKPSMTKREDGKRQCLFVIAQSHDVIEIVAYNLKRASFQSMLAKVRGLVEWNNARQRSLKAIVMSKLGLHHLTEATDSAADDLEQLPLHTLAKHSHPPLDRQALDLQTSRTPETNPDASPSLHMRTSELVTLLRKIDPLPPMVASTTIEESGDLLSIQAQHVLDSIAVLQQQLAARAQLERLHQQWCLDSQQQQGHLERNERAISIRSVLELRKMMRLVHHCSAPVAGRLEPFAGTKLGSLPVAEADWHRQVQDEALLFYVQYAKRLEFMKSFVSKTTSPIAELQQLVRNNSLCDVAMDTLETGHAFLQRAEGYQNTHGTILLEVFCKGSYLHVYVWAMHALGFFTQTGRPLPRAVRLQLSQPKDFTEACAAVTDQLHVNSSAYDFTVDYISEILRARSMQCNGLSLAGVKLRRLHIKPAHAQALDRACLAGLPVIVESTVNWHVRKPFFSHNRLLRVKLPVAQLFVLAEQHLTPFCPMQSAVRDMLAQDPTAAVASRDDRQALIDRYPELAKTIARFFDIEQLQMRLVSSPGLYQLKEVDPDATVKLLYVDGISQEDDVAAMMAVDPLTLAREARSFSLRSNLSLDLRPPQVCASMYAICFTLPHVLHRRSCIILSTTSWPVLA